MFLLSAVLYGENLSNNDCYQYSVYSSEMGTKILLGPMDFLLNYKEFVRPIDLSIEVLI